MKKALILFFAMTGLFTACSNKAAKKDCGPEHCTCQNTRSCDNDCACKQ